MNVVHKLNKISVRISKKYRDLQIQNDICTTLLKRRSVHDPVVIAAVAKYNATAEAIRELAIKKMLLFRLLTDDTEANKHSPFEKETL